MSEQKSKTSTSQPAASGKKPYVKPDYRHERMFETMALQCGKRDPTQAQCKYNMNVS